MSRLGSTCVVAMIVSAFCAGRTHAFPPTDSGRLSARTEVDAPSLETRRTAVERAVKVLERGARNYPSHRTCFACHHQTFPLLAQTSALRLGWAIDRPSSKIAAQHTVAWFNTQKERLVAGQRIDGRAITVAYGLWTLELADRPADSLSDALVANLLAIQNADGYWEPEAHRPPAEESKLFVTALSLRGLQRYARGGHREESQRAIARAFPWMRRTSPESIDDHVGALLAHVWLKDSTLTPDERLAELVTLRVRLLDQQQVDGGWAQRSGMASDAYATGLVLWSLAESRASSQSSAYARGAARLLATQEADGSWRVESHCEPVQTYFDNGDPHGEDQFLSLMATGWAAAALAY
ncbi:MAG: hypothetical protein U1A77_06100 [Pirellulales bacterium]